MCTCLQAKTVYVSGPQTGTIESSLGFPRGQGLPVCGVLPQNLTDTLSNTSYLSFHQHTGKHEPAECQRCLTKTMAQSRGVFGFVYFLKSAMHLLTKNEVWIY